MNTPKSEERLADSGNGGWSRTGDWALGQWGHTEVISYSFGYVPSFINYCLYYMSLLS